MTSNPIPTHIADLGRAAELARAAGWIEHLALRLESDIDPNNGWFRAVRPGWFDLPEIAGAWRCSNISEAVKALVCDDLKREWHELDRFLFVS
jgi:hypothetical protein